MSFIDHPMFRRIYSLYSNNNDSEKRRFAFPPFSNRCFPQREHVTQVKMKIDGNALWHNDFVKPKFLKLLPSIISELDSWDPILSPTSKPLIDTAKLQPNGPKRPDLALICIPDVTHSLSVRTADKYLLT